MSAWVSYVRVDHGREWETLTVPPQLSARIGESQRVSPCEGTRPQTSAASNLLVQVDPSICPTHHLWTD